MLRLFLAGLLLIYSSELLPQSPLIAARLTGAINFDGVPEEEPWQSVQPFKMVMFSPIAGNEPSGSSVIRIAYDDEYLYLSGILKYNDPADIRAVARKRDYSNSDCDWFGVLLDTYNDRKNGVSFWTNPNGLRTDGTVQNDYADLNNDVSFNWNTFWDVKTRITEKGWSAEFRIPFSSLRFQTENEKTIMGITICWYIPSKPEMNTFPAVPPISGSSYWKPSLTTLIEFDGLRPKKPVYITPYVTAGIGQANKLNKGATDYKMDTRWKFDAGIDAKLSLSNNLTLDLTANTDFAQVEADDQKINLTRYSLYFPEKRSFFLEKSDVFDFSFLGGNNLFYSRRIGLFDGNPVRIYGGIRMTGRINKWDIGVFDLQTERYEENPGENFGVFRTKRSIINQGSFVGGMVTTRLGMNGNYNLAYGLDGLFNVTGNEYLTVKVAQTFENDSLNKFLSLAPTRILLNWEHRNQKGFGYDFVYTWSGDHFNPGVGFEVKDNYQGIRGILRYGWFPAETDKIRFHEISLTATNFWNTLTGLQETNTNELQWSFEAKKGYYGYLGLLYSTEDLTDTLVLGNDQASVPPGRYSFLNMLAQYGTSRKNAISSTFTAEAGKFYDGWKLSLYVYPRLNIGRGLSLGVTYSLDYVNFPLRSTAFTNHIAGFRGLITMTTSTSLSAFVQYNTAVNKISTNIRFRFNPREGNDFYVVYDEGLNTNLIRETPALHLSAGRTILLKYAYTFRF